MEKLKEALADLGITEAAIGEFRAAAFFDSTMDYLEYLREDKFTVSDRVDQFLTLILDAHSREVIGFRLKGFRAIFNRLKPALSLRDEDFVTLIQLIEHIATLEGEQFLADQKRVDRYREARALAKRDDVKVEKDFRELLAA